MTTSNESITPKAVLLVALALLQLCLNGATFLLYRAMEHIDIRIEAMRTVDARQDLEIMRLDTNQRRVLQDIEELKAAVGSLKHIRQISN